MKMVSLLTIIAMGLLSVHVNILHATIGAWHPNCSHTADHHDGCSHSHDHSDECSHGDEAPETQRSSHDPCCHDHHEYFARMADSSPDGQQQAHAAFDLPIPTSLERTLVWTPVRTPGPLIQGKHPPVQFSPLLI